MLKPFYRYAFAIFALTFIAFLSPTVLRADTVVLKNGDKLTGTAVKLDGGKLTFKTSYGDAIAIAWDQVTHLTVTTPLILPSPKGNLSVTEIERTDAGLVVTTSTGPSTLDPKVVTVLRSPADEKTYEASLHPNWAHEWTGAGTLSLALARGNSETTTFGAGLTAVRPTLHDKTSLYANFLYATNGNSTPSLSANTDAGGFRYDHNLNPKIFAFGTADFYADALQELDLRSILGGGIGWHASKTPKQTMDIFAGVVYTHESYSATATAASTNNNFPALTIGEQYTRKFGAGSVLTEQATFYPDLADSGDYQFTFVSAFNTKLWKMLTWNTAFTDNYTSFPPAGTLDNDLTLTTGVGITFAHP